MSLFSYYQSSGKEFPCGADGFLVPNFKREWILAIGRVRFALDNEQNIRTWQREWPTLDADSKKTAMGNLIKMLALCKVDDSSSNVSNAQTTLKLLDPYLAVFTNEDTLAWTTAFMSADLAKRSAQDHEIPTLTFAAHLLDWTRENRPSVLKKCVAMLEDWDPLTRPKLYKEDDALPDALERLSSVLPNTTLERTCALACAISGQDALLTQLLSRADTKIAPLLKHAQSMAENGPLFSMFSALKATQENAIFFNNACKLGTQMFSVYEDMAAFEKKTDSRKLLNGEELRRRGDFLNRLVDFGVDCSNASLALLKTQRSQFNIGRFFYFLGELSQQWSAEQHKDFMDDWSYHGGYYLGEDMFGTAENRKGVIVGLSKLPPEWTEWFEFEYREKLQESGAGIMDPQKNGLGIAEHRWFYEHMPSVYKHWIRGLPANPELLQDPVVGEAAWTYTRAGSEQFLFEATMAWIKSPETNYDLRNRDYPLAKLAWAHKGIDLEASLTSAMLDTQSDYRSLAVEAVSPGQGKNRWQALMCVIDVFKETGDTRAHWSDQPLVQEALRISIQERLNPGTDRALVIENGEALFASGL